MNHHSQEMQLGKFIFLNKLLIIYKKRTYQMVGKNCDAVRKSGCNNRTMTFKLKCKNIFISAVLSSTDLHTNKQLDKKNLKMQFVRMNLTYIVTM